MIRNKKKKTQNCKRKKMEIIQANEDKMLSQKIVLFYQRDILYKSHGLNKLQIQKRDTKLKKKKNKERKETEKH